MTEPGWWGVAEAASHCGMTEGDWRTRVSRGSAPPAERGTDPGIPPNRRNPQWRPETVIAFHSSRNRKRGRPKRQG